MLCQMFRFFCLFSLIGGIVVVAYAQRQPTLSIVRVAPEIQEKELRVEYTLNRNLPSAYTATLNYLTVDKAGTASAESPQSASVKDKTLLFQFSRDKLTGAARFEYRMIVRTANGTTVLETVPSGVDLRPLEEIERQKQKNTEWQQKLFDTEEKAKKDLKAKDDVINERDAALQKINGDYQATQFYSAEPAYVTDNKIVVIADLNLPGRVSGTIKCKDCSPGFTPFLKNSEPGPGPNKAKLTFENLQSGKTYMMELNIFNIERKKDDQLASPYKSREIKTGAQKSSLSLRSDPKFDTDEEGRLKMELNINEPGLVQITYAENTGGKTGEPEVKGKFEFDEMSSKPKGLSVKPGDTIILDKAKPGKKYSVTLTGMNEYGVKSDLGQGQTFFADVEESTALKFDPSQPIILDVNPLGMTLKWKTNIKPDTATFEIEYPDPKTPNARTSEKKEISYPKDDKDKNKPAEISLTLDPTTSLKIVNGTTAAAEKKIANPPIIIARMTKTERGKLVSVEQRLQLTYSMPKQEDVNKELSSEANRPLKEALTAVINASKKESSKIEWGKLAKSGLSFFLKAVL